MAISLLTARTWAEVDLDLIVTNYHNALLETPAPCRHIVVLKAGAYGLGAVPIAQTLYEEGARHFAVACVGEGLELTRGLPEDAWVFVMGQTMPEERELAVQAGLVITVYDEESIHALAAVSAKLNRVTEVQLKVDTGLHRLGCDAKDAPALARLILSYPSLVWGGVFSHLQRRSNDYDRGQATQLWAVKEALEAVGLQVPLLHLLDSIGMWRYPEHQWDAVRDAAFVLGHTPLDFERPEQLTFSLSFKTRVVRVHDVPAGECLGYDNLYPLTTPRRIATLCMGYGDGYPRTMAQRGEVEVHGKRARVLGTVCMDLSMIDVTDIPDVQVGDIVTLLGGSIGIHEYADFIQAYKNETLVMLSRRVPRIYYRHGEPVAVWGGLF